MDDEDLMLDGIDDAFDGEDAFDISGPDSIDAYLDQALGAATPRLMLRRAAAARIRPGAQINRRLAGTIGRIAKISKGLYAATGKVEAEYMRRPNTGAAVYTPVIAPGATSAFSVQPGTGNSFYRLLGFIVSDEQANLFGFTSLKVGGQEHINYTQSTPAAPVSNAVPWSVYALKESSLQTNLAPWVGQVFDANTPILGTIVNVTVAASGDALTVAARGVWLCQTDPCGFRYPFVAQQASAFWGKLRRSALSLSVSPAAMRR